MTLSLDKVPSEHGPSPTDFDLYLPWACKQMDVPYNIVIKKSYINVYTPVSMRSRRHSKVFKLKGPLADTESKISSPLLFNAAYDDSTDVVIIKTFYNVNKNLVHIQFAKNSHVPTAVLKMMNLIVKFQPNLNTITIDKGLDQAGLYELNKTLNLTKVTEVILDNTTMPQANYYILLDDHTSLNYLSLVRCSLNDAVIEKIASRLSTSNLSVLNLSSNRITDEGAICLGNILRSNRKLRYLSLAGNMITDIGADSILSCLMEFVITAAELNDKKIKFLAYLKEKYDLEMKIFDELTIKELDKTKFKSRRNKIEDESNDLRNVHIKLQQKARSTADSMVGPFRNAFKIEEVVTRDKVTYCYGNNALSYINLAYNDLTYFSIKKLYKVLKYQNEMNRKPKGLINFCIEGNNIPDTCFELREITRIINDNLNNVNNFPLGKKK